MTFFLSKLWFWWLLAILVAAALTAWLCHWLSRPRKLVVDDRPARELADARAAAARHEAKVNELLSHRAKDLDELTALRAQLGTVDDLRTRLRTLEADAGKVPSLEAEVRTLHSEAAKVGPLEGDVVTLRREIGDLLADNARLVPLQNRLVDLEAEAAAGRDARAELQGLRGRLAELEAQARSAPVAAFADTSASVSGPADADGGAERVAGLEARIGELEGALAAALAAAPVDTSGSAAVLGKRVAADDLKVVEGIGPKIEELLLAGGVATWRQLAAAPVARLKEILDAAGPRYQVHDPGSWPRQAELLAGARWAEFKELTDQLKGGRA